MWAITPGNVADYVGARRIKEDWPLENGETFTVAYYSPNMVLAEDGASLRYPTPEEVARLPSPPTSQEIVDATFSGNSGDLLLDIILDIQNRIEALEGNPAITKAALKDKIKGLLGSN